MDMKKFLELWKKYSYVLLLAFIIAGIFDFRIAITAIACMIAPVIISVSRGRFWCGNLCPRGSFYDNIVSKFSKKKVVPKFLKSIYFRAFVVLFMFTMFGIGIKNNWGNPAGIGMVFYRIIVVTTLIGVILSFFYNNRTWCHFCPMGTMAHYVSKGQPKREKSSYVHFDTSLCVNCKKCSKVCPMSIDLLLHKESCIVSDADCIKCGQCVENCPRASLKLLPYEKVS
jgi:polyferredoxin